MSQSREPSIAIQSEQSSQTEELAETLTIPNNFDIYFVFTVTRNVISMMFITDVLYKNIIIFVILITI